MNFNKGIPNKSCYHENPIDLVDQHGFGKKIQLVFKEFHPDKI